MTGYSYFYSGSESVSSMFVIVGSVTADLLVFSDAPLSHIGDNGFRADNLIFTDRPLSVLMGGNGGNSAYVLAGLGAQTTVCGAVGRDPLGETLVKWFIDRGVSLAGLHRSSTHATSTSTIIAAGADSQVVFHHLGATRQVTFEQMPANLFATAEALLCTSYPIMSGLRPDGFAKMLAITHKNGGITALDIGPAIGQLVTPAELIPMFPHLDYLIANTHELANLTGYPKCETAVQSLLTAGARNVVIKRGKTGASLRGQAGCADVPAFPVTANISVGAGDAFNVGFLYGLRQKLSPPETLRFANAVAALVVSNNQGVLGSPTLDQVEAFLNRS